MILNMFIPLELQQAIDSLSVNQDLSKVRFNATNICKKYAYESGNGKKLVKTLDEVIAYAIARMPATYAAAYTILEDMCEQYNGSISTLTDLGAGTGAVSWAINELFPISRIICVEREKNMINVAKRMINYGGESVKNAKWIEGSVTSELRIEKSDLVVASYVMNELKEEDKQIFLDNTWCGTDNFIMIIEPGTMIGYRNILRARNYFLDRGASIIAPCTHNRSCELDRNDWCHFSCRIQRNKIQKYVKKGDAPFEDEKFSYIIVSKDAVKHNNMRIVRHPIINKGYVDLKVCSKDGIKDVKITAKNKGLYKTLKKAKWGDVINIDEGR